MRSREPRSTATCLIGAALLAMVGCAADIPPDKQDYIGQWRNGTMSLSIDADGSVEYERREDRSTTRISAPIKAFEGDNLVVGIGPVNTTFVVNRRPHQVGEQWQFQVDGQMLLRAPAEALP